MASLLLVLFVPVIAVNVLFGLAIPRSVTARLALMAGVLLARERFHARKDQK